MQETQVWSLSWEDPLKKEIATHCNTLACKIPWMGESGRQQSMGWQRVRQLNDFTFTYFIHNFIYTLYIHTHTHTHTHTHIYIAPTPLLVSKHFQLCVCAIINEVLFSSFHFYMLQSKRKNYFLHQFILTFLTNSHINLNWFF